MPRENVFFSRAWQDYGEESALVWQPGQAPWFFAPTGGKVAGMDETLAETLAGWRRHLHAHPELSLHEKATAAFVRARLTELGVPFVAGVGGHGVVATLTRGASNRSVGLRADMTRCRSSRLPGCPTPPPTPA